MGIPAYNLTHSISLVIAQRLARQLCAHCKSISNEKLYIPLGCEQCNHTGYKGRCGIFELLPISEAIREIIMRQTNTDEILQQARAEGMQTLQDNGFIKATQGITSVAEIHRVIYD